MGEEVLVDVYPQGTKEEYEIFLENLSFPSFSRLMEMARSSNELVRRTSWSSSANSPSRMTQFVSKKKKLIVTTLRIVKGPILQDDLLQ